MLMLSNPEFFHYRINELTPLAFVIIDGSFKKNLLVDKSNNPLLKYA